MDSGLSISGLYSVLPPPPWGPLDSGALCYFVFMLRVRLPLVPLAYSQHGDETGSPEKQKQTAYIKIHRDRCITGDWLTQL